MNTKKRWLLIKGLQSARLQVVNQRIGTTKNKSLYRRHSPHFASALHRRVRKDITPKIYLLCTVWGIFKKEARKQKLELVVNMKPIKNMKGSSAILGPNSCLSSCSVTNSRVGDTVILRLKSSSWCLWNFPDGVGSRRVEIHVFHFNFGNVWRWR
jgi:hypothetical protein